MQPQPMLDDLSWDASLGSAGEGFEALCCSPQQAPEEPGSPRVFVP